MRALRLTLKLPNMLLAMLLLLVLSGCTDAAEELLEGDRIPVFGASAASDSVESRLSRQGDDTSLLELPTSVSGLDWPQQGGEAGHALQYVSLPSARDLRVAWTAALATPLSPAQAALPVVSGGRLFAYDGKETVHSFDAESGRRLWQSGLDKEGEKGNFFGGGIAVSEGRVFVTTGFGLFYALSAEDGSELWRVSVGEPSRSSPVVGGERVFFVTNSNRTIALSALSGEVLWTHTGALQQVYVSYSSPPGLHGSSLIVPATTGEFIALVADSGLELWAEQAQGDSSELGFRAPAMPVMNGAQAFLLGPTGLSVVELSTGFVSWEVDVKGDEQPWIAGSHLFVPYRDTLLSLHREDGAVRWISTLTSEGEGDGEVRWFSPRLVEDGLLVLSSAGDLRLLDADSGAELYRDKLSRPPLSPPVVAGGMLFYSTANGQLVALR
ncbi:MAG: PQQ-binding-like beta-propeller repeat protein [Alphaproteobacteria bacterium]